MVENGADCGWLGDVMSIETTTGAGTRHDGVIVITLPRRFNGSCRDQLRRLVVVGIGDAFVTETPAGTTRITLAALPKFLMGKLTEEELLQLAKAYLLAAQDWASDQPTVLQVQYTDPERDRVRQEAAMALTGIWPTHLDAIDERARSL